jgi:putative ABC transport system permease protein
MVSRSHPALRTKLRRDIVGQWPQFAAVVLIVLLGVGLFAASYNAYRNLRASYDRVFADERFADLFVTVRDADRFAATARTSPGVAAVSTRTEADLPVAVGADKLRGRVVGYPVGAPPAVNRLTLLRGSWLGGPDDVLVEHHMAEHFGLDTGDRVTVTGATGPRRLRVAGVVSSGEYLWPARSRQEPFTSPDDFGVLFAAEPTARDLAGAEQPDQVLVRMDPAAAPGDLGRLAGAATAAGASTVLTRAEQPSNALLQEDITGFREMALAFPLLFLSAAGLATYVLLSRRVNSERPLIGMLRAQGMRRRAIAAHYVGYGLVAGLAGAVLGVVLGTAGAVVLSHAYVGIIDLPARSQVITALRPLTVLGGLAYGLAVGALAAWGPAVAAARVPAAEAMRSAAPVGDGARSLLERLVPGSRRLPARWRMALRGVGRNPRRTAFTATGVAMALLLILVSWTMIDTMNALLGTQFDVVARQDAQVDLSSPAEAARVEALRAVPGVAAVEPLVQVPATLVNGDRAYSTLLSGMDPHTTMHGWRPAGGAASALPADGILVGRGVTGTIGVHAGDEVTLRLPTLGRSARVRVAGLLDEPLGTFAYASRDWLDATVGPVAATSALLRLDPGADPAAVRRAVSDLPGVVAYTDARSLQRLWDSFAGLFLVFVGGMLVLGALMAGGIIFTTMSVNVTERRRELATLRAAGVRYRSLARLVAGENLLVALLGVVPGLLLGVLGGTLFLDSFSSDQFRLSLVVMPGTLVFATLAVLVTAALAQWPALRSVRRTDLAAAVRERGG